MYGFDNMPMSLGMGGNYFNSGYSLLEGAKPPAQWGNPQPGMNPFGIANIAMGMQNQNKDKAAQQAAYHQEMVRRLTEMNQAQMQRNRGLLG